MAFIRTLLDRILVRVERDRALESRILRDRFSKLYDIEVGLYTTYGAFDRWRVPPGTRIGRYCSISTSARIIEANHPVDSLSTHEFFYISKYGVVPHDRVPINRQVIEDDVWLGHNAIVTPSCRRIGRGAVIGAGSVVVDDVPPYAVMLGAPARLLRYRFAPELIAAIEATRWWLLDKAQLQAAAKAAPQFLVAPSLSDVRQFARALGVERAVEQAIEQAAAVAAEAPTAPPDRDVSGRRGHVLLAALESVKPGLGEADLGRPFADLGIDSLATINLRLALERAIGRPVSDSAWGAIRTPADLLGLAGTDVAAAGPAVASTTASISSAGDPMYWLPPLSEVERRSFPDPAERRDWFGYAELANRRLDFLQTERLAAHLARVLPAGPGEAARSVRVALLSSSTSEHLAAGVVVGLLRRGLRAEVYVCDYGQYRQELLRAGSDLHAFRPDVVVFALDATHLLAGSDLDLGQAEAAEFVEQKANDIQGLWTLAREAFSAQVIHQAPLPTAPSLMGSNEQRLPGSAAALLQRLQARLMQCADAAGVDILDLNAQLRRTGLQFWHDPSLWLRNKQEISPLAAPLYGELLARVVAARRGLSSKCLVLDLDNTLWGGVIGDDGLSGIRLGQGSGEGEAHVALQAYAKSLSKRGIILAVCSKNDEANAFQVFDEHPEMVLRRNDIASFVANWSDKATNLERIATQLNIGLDALVFVDDNPFERGIVRTRLPMVRTPELPEDPAHWPSCLADAGYFESLEVTGDDRKRSEQYRLNAEREALKSDVADIGAYLSTLDMDLRWSEFDPLNLQRVTQLINKTNQFNLTTRRYTEQQVRDVIADPAAIGLHFRLIDRFGDNGIIAIVIGRIVDGGQTMEIDTWLMSCRVIGRQVEEATLDVVADVARRAGASALVGRYFKTEKNGMVEDHYAKLGFLRVAAEGSETSWRLDLSDHVPSTSFIRITPLKHMVQDA